MDVNRVGTMVRSWLYLLAKHGDDGDDDESPVSELWRRIVQTVCAAMQEQK